jgi:uncharacterized protein (DUF488 family)
MNDRLFTIGHSNHTLDRFLELLRRHDIEAVGDVRSSPYSRYVPHFNQAALRPALERAGIAYLFLGRELGARPDDASVYVDGRVSYERLAQRPAFRAGLEKVRAETCTRRLALLCAEKDPLACHRTILVCRALRGSGLYAQHILADGTLEASAAAERRLYALFKLAPNLFEGEDAIIEQAYDQQAERIAYAREDAEILRFPQDDSPS